MNWKNADQPPHGKPGLWTAEVVAVTNLGGVFKLAYFHGESGDGHWQRPSRFNDGEQVEWWIESPHS